MAPEHFFNPRGDHDLEDFGYPPGADQPVGPGDGPHRFVAPHVMRAGPAQFGETVGVARGQRVPVFIAEVGQAPDAETERVKHFVLRHLHDRRQRQPRRRQFLHKRWAEVDEAGDGPIRHHVPVAQLGEGLHPPPPALLGRLGRDVKDEIGFRDGDAFTHLVAFSLRFGVIVAQAARVQMGRRHFDQAAHRLLLARLGAAQVVGV